MRKSQPRHPEHSQIAQGYPYGVEPYTMMNYSMPYYDQNYYYQNQGYAGGHYLRNTQHPQGFY